MRPVHRGPVPEAGGTPRTYKAYGDARDDLFARLGDYCSYCEMCCHNGPAVEHVQPKRGEAGHPELELTWDNFLLGCVFCNSTKGDRQVVLSDCYWPDQDNTFRALKYELDRAPLAADGLSHHQRRDNGDIPQSRRGPGMAGNGGFPNLGLAIGREGRWPGDGGRSEPAERARTAPRSIGVDSCGSRSETGLRAAGRDPNDAAGRPERIGAARSGPVYLTACRPALRTEVFQPDRGHFRSGSLWFR